MDYEHELEHYLQGHFHPEVAPLVRREIKQDTVSIQGFLRIMKIVEINHVALDDELISPPQELNTNYGNNT